MICMNFTQKKSYKLEIKFHLIVQLAQEKYELQIERDEMEAMIAKTEVEINAMENTLKWFKATNSNFKFCLDAADENGMVTQIVD